MKSSTSPFVDVQSVSGSGVGQRCVEREKKTSSGLTQWEVLVDFSQFKSAKQFGGWLGLVPSQNSSGGKNQLGRITKRGDTYLRTLLIQGAKSVVFSASKREDRTSQWVRQLKERIGWQKAVVAIANKNARILWCVMTRGQAYDPDHVPQLAGSQA